jgi:hypothetical protein
MRQRRRAARPHLSRSTVATRRGVRFVFVLTLIGGTGCGADRVVRLDVRPSACTAGHIGLTYHSVYVEPVGYLIRSVTVSQDVPRCAGEAVRVVLSDDAGKTLGEGSAVIAPHSTTTIVDMSGNPAAELVAKSTIVIGVSDRPSPSGPSQPASFRRTGPHGETAAPGGSRSGMHNPNRRGTT